MLSDFSSEELILICLGLTNTLGINLPVFNKYSKYAGVLICLRLKNTVICLCLTNTQGHINLPVSNNNTGAFIFLCLTDKRLKYLILSNKFIYVILYQYNGN